MTQQKVFIQHLELAKEYSLPVILHCRGSKENPKDGYKELLKVILDNISLKPKGVMHCFQSDLDIAQQFLDLGFYLGFDGPITYKDASPAILDTIKNAPLERMLLETDSPYLTPEPHRGERNEPLYIRFVAQKIAEIKNMSFDDVIEVTTKNAVQLFNLYQ
ncbi:TatD family hydrolase, partial [Patescibacteria group bacterium AH-259-L05]|nr:TatD family hydrolase [Patescibacteria group bacterium AH-259-L05]